MTNMTLVIMKAVFGIIIYLVPGLLISHALFKNRQVFMRLAFGLGFTFIINCIIVLSLGGTKNIARLTGGITNLNVIIANFILIIILCVLLRNDLKNFLLRIIKIDIFRDIKTNGITNKKRLIIVQAIFVLIIPLYFILKATSGFSALLFWPLIMVNIGLCFINIMRADINGKIFSLLLMQIALTSVYVFGYIEPHQMLVDSYFELQTGDLIIKNGYWDPTAGSGFAEDYYGYNPVLHMNIAVLSNLTGLSPLIITKYVLIFILRIALFLCLFYAIKNLLKINDNKKISLIVMLGMFSHVAIVYYLNRRTMGSFFIIFSVLCLFEFLNKKNVMNFILLFISMIMIIMSDHSHVYITFALLSIYFLSALYRKIVLKNRLNEGFIIYKMTIIFIVLYSSYLIFFANTFIEVDYNYITKTQNTLMGSYSKVVDQSSHLIKRTFTDLYEISAENIIVDREPFLLEETLEQNHTSNLSIDKGTNITLFQPQRSRTNIDAENYHTGGFSMYSLYDMAIILTGQIIYVLMGLLSIIYLIYRKKLVIWIPFFIVCLIVYVTLGIFYTSTIGVFTTVFFDIFGLGFAAAIGYVAFSVLKNIRVWKKACLIFLICVCFSSVMIMNFTPNVINRDIAEAKEISTIHRITAEPIAAIEWINSPAVLEIDRSLYGVYNGLYKFETVSNYYSKRLRASSHSRLAGLLQREAQIGNYKFSNRKHIDLVVMFYPRGTESGQMTGYERSLSRIHENRKIYSNGKIIIYDNYIKDQDIP